LAGGAGGLFTYTGMLNVIVILLKIVLWSQA